MIGTFVLLLIFATCRAEIFTSTDDIERMLSAEKTVVEIMADYLRTEADRLIKLRNFIDEYSKKTTETLASGRQSLTNPINAFITVKRLTTGWNYGASQMQGVDPGPYLEAIKGKRSHGVFPNSDDLEGAAFALFRLQDTYRLDTSEMANGRLGSYGAKPSQQLSAADCFDIAKIAAKDADYYHAVPWMQESFNRAVVEESPAPSPSEALELLSTFMYRQGNLKGADQVAQQLYKREPTRPKVPPFDAEKRADERSGKPKPEFSPGHRPNRHSKRLSSQERDVYEALCRGEGETRPDLERTLHCHYATGHPYLSIARYGVEELSRGPIIYLFKNVISDKEIERVVELARPRLKSAIVGSAVELVLRASKSAWLAVQDKVVARITKRISMLTGLDSSFPSGAEPLQVANYGLGGHYIPHFDYFQTKARASKDRLATFLIYMVEPEAGGATVFTKLNLTVQPTAGDAAFWYNNHKDGRRDARTRHAACPVLSGVKWVSNKWIFDRGNEFNRPCSLHQDDNE